ncbi:MAG: multicopper oxidase domain-containing protein [Nocardiopsaceae bacterium]|nr:multicopper oxidase domain-containing protein [Nocardiopsaceae bacterium]
MADQVQVMPAAISTTADQPWPGPENPVRPGETLAPFVAPLDPPRAHVLVPWRVHEIDIAETTTSIHPGLPAVPAWGFAATGPAGSPGPVSSPGPLLEAEAGEMTLVRWRNRLPASLRPGQSPPARLPIATAVLEDPDEDTDSVQNHLGADGGKPEDLSGVPVGWTTIHLHGAHAPSDADGWPDNMAATGSEQVSGYPNSYDNTDLGLAKAGEFLWYHDHAMNGTRYHNYSGLAGPYLVRDPRERELGLPVSRDDGEIVLMLADRNLDLGADGRLRLLHKTTTDTAEAFGPLTLVNGTLWPRLTLRPDVYRLRLLNASNARTYRLHLVSVRDNPDGTVTVTPRHQRVLVIGADGGLLWRAWRLADDQALTLASAERFDILVDLTGLADGERLLLVNSAPAPFGGDPVPDLDALLTRGDRPGRNPYPWVARLDVDSAAPLAGAPHDLFTATAAATLNPAYRRLVRPAAPPPAAGSPAAGSSSAAGSSDHGPETLPVTDASVTTILLAETTPPGHLYLQQLVADPAGKIAIQFPGQDKPEKYRVVQWPAHDRSPSSSRVSFYDRVGSRPVIDQWQVFRFVNATGDTHPMHIHLSQFQPLGAAGTTLKVTDAQGNNLYDPTKRVAKHPLKPDPATPPRAFEPTETQGWKDVIRIDPGNVVEVAGRFDIPGRYVYHCHILEHEDTEMMQPIVVTVTDMTDGSMSSMPGM